MGDLRRQRLGGRPGRPGDEEETGPGKRRVADEGDLFDGHVRQEPQGHGVADVERAAESPGDEDAVEVGGFQPEFAEHELDPASERGHRKLDVPDVLLGQGEPIRQPDALLRPDDAAVATEEPAGHGAGQDIDEPRPADPLGRQVFDRPELEAVIPPGPVDGAGDREHAAADGHALEGRAGRRRRGDEFGALFEDDLAVGPEIDEQPRARLRGEARGHESGGDVAADEALDVGRDVNAGLRMQGEADLAGGERRQDREDGVERGQGQRIHGDAAEDVVHGRVAGDDGVVDPVPRDAAPPAHRPDEVVDELNGRVSQAAEVVRVLEGEGDAGDDVGAVGALGVDGRFPVGDPARPQVDELGRDRGRAQIDGQPERFPAGFFGLDVEDLAVVVEDGRDRPRRAGGRAAQLGQGGQGQVESRRFELGPERIGHSGRDIERRLLQDESELFDGRIDISDRREPGVEDGDPLEPGPGQGLYGDIAAHDIEAGEPMVRPQAAAFEERGLERRGEGEGAVENADGTLAADPPLVAVKAYRDAGPDEDVGQDLSGPGPDFGPFGQDLDGE